MTAATSRDVSTASPLALSNSRFPTGWFQVAWIDEIGVGEVKRVHYFDQDIALWRGQSGQLYATDPYCLHQGANMAVGGKVEGEDIVCPFHGWLWSGEGRNTDIPWSRHGCKKNLRIRSWEVREINHCVLVWHDLDGNPPYWEPEAIDGVGSDEYYPITDANRQRFTIKAHLQLVRENGPDAFHVQYVHGGQPAKTLKYDIEGHKITQLSQFEFGNGKKSTWLTPNGAETVHLQSWVWGPALAAIRWPDIFSGAISFTNTTPIDDERIDYQFTMTLRREPGDDGDVPTGKAKRILELQRRTIQQDFPIWENMRLLDTYNFAPEEIENYRQQRQFARQFYPDLRKLDAERAAAKAQSGADAQARTTGNGVAAQSV